MVRVLSETLESRERRRRARSALVRPELLAGEVVLDLSWGVGNSASCMV